MAVAGLQTQLEVYCDKIEEIRAPDIASLTRQGEVETINGNIGSDHLTRETLGSDHVILGSDHVTLVSDHVTLGSDHVTLGSDHVTSGSDHVTLGSDHVTLGSDHVTLGSDHVTLGSDHVTLGSDDVTLGSDHVTLGSDHVTLGSDHVTLGSDHVTLGSDHVILGSDHVTEQVEEDTDHNQEEGNPVGEEAGPVNQDILGSENMEDNGPSPLVPATNDLSSDSAADQPVDHGSSADLECQSESETTPEVKSCPHSHQFVNDLSSEEKSSGSEDETRDMTVLRRARREKKRRKRQQRLKRCCSGCDSQGNVEPVSPELPSPIARSSGMLQCNVIKSFDEVVSTRYNSEEEIDAAIQSYTTIGSRLANQSEQTFSDVEIAANKSRSECGSPCSDPDLLVCDYSNSVGRKLANRSPQLDDDLDGCIGGYLLDTLTRNLDPSSRLNAMNTKQLSALIDDMNLKLQTVNEALVGEVKENDDLKAQKSVITKHISQLTRLAQGKRANDCSAFRKILVTRETDL